MKIDMVKKSVSLCMDANLTAFVQGSPGLGKSAIVREIAEERNLELIDVRLTQCDITDLNGLPKLDGAKATFLPFDTFPVDGDPLPQGRDGWLLFLDELNSANKSVQASAYKLILDRMVGNHHLHGKVSIVAAGNLITDNAVVNSLSTALRSRMVNLVLESDSGLWIDWAMDHGVDPRVMAYIQYKPTNLFNFDPNKDEDTYACPRTWDMLSRLLSHMGRNQLDTFAELIVGIVGKIGLEFIAYAKYALELPSLEEIKSGHLHSDPKWEVGKIWMVLFHILSKFDQVVTEREIENVLNYVAGFGKEYLTILISRSYRMADVRPRLIASPCFRHHMKLITDFSHQEPANGKEEKADGAGSDAAGEKDGGKKKSKSRSRSGKDSEDKSDSGKESGTGATPKIA